eukprot:650707-Amphidinium_carterae.1
MVRLCKGIRRHVMTECSMPVPDMLLEAAQKPNEQMYKSHIRHPQKYHPITWQNCKLFCTFLVRVWGFPFSEMPMKIHRLLLRVIWSFGGVWGGSRSSQLAKHSTLTHYMKIARTEHSNCMEFKTHFEKKQLSRTGRARAYNRKENGTAISTLTKNSSGVSRMLSAPLGNEGSLLELHALLAAHASCCKN